MKTYRIHYNGATTIMSGKIPSHLYELATHVEKEVVPTGDWYKSSETLERRDAIRKWSGIGENESIEDLISGYYVRATKSGDICLYCGADNGPNGEYRVGFDCNCCGGN